MDTNWIIISLVVILGITLIILLVLKDQKEKRDLVKSINAETDLETERDKDIDIES